MPSVLEPITARAGERSNLTAPFTRNGLLLVLAALSLSGAVYFCCDFYGLRRKLA